MLKPAEFSRQVSAFYYMWLFRRDLALWRTPVRLRVTKSRLLHLNEFSPFILGFKKSIKTTRDFLKKFLTKHLNCGIILIV